MSKRPKSLSDRLILLVARLGERATVHNITGWHLTGAALQQAKVDAEGLVKWEEVYQTRFVGRHNLARRSQKPSLTAVLTKAGIWRAAQLGVPYRHDLVATLLAQKDHPTPHSRSEKEHAAETAALVEDGREYRRQLAARKTAKDAAEKARLVGPRRKRSAHHYAELNKFLASRGRPPANVPAVATRLPLPSLRPSTLEEFRSQTSREPSHMGNVQMTPVPPARRAPASTFADELWAVQGRQLAGFGEPTRGFSNDPKPEIRASSGETRSEVVARARASGHFYEGAFHTTDNQVVTWQAWAAWAPK
jgi:hypothetical protein